MIVIDPRREDGADARDMRDAVEEISQCLALCPPVESSRASVDVPVDGHRHVVLPNVPVRALTALVEILEREGWRPPPRRRPLKTAEPERVRSAPEDEARVREFAAGGYAMTPAELRRLARTGEWPAWCDTSA